MKAVEDQPHRAMIGATNDLPRVPVVVDEPAPGKGLETDPEAPPGRPLAQFVQVDRRAIDAPPSMFGHVGADQDQIRADLLHHVELALGPAEGLGAERLGQTFEVAEGLEQRDGETGVPHHLANLARGMVEGDEVALEDLDAVEPGLRDGFDLVPEITAQGYCRDRGFHGGLPPGTWSVWRTSTAPDADRPARFRR